MFLGKHGYGFLTLITQEEIGLKVKLVTRRRPHWLFQTHHGPLPLSLTQLQTPWAFFLLSKCAQQLLTS